MTTVRQSSFSKASLVFSVLILVSAKEGEQGPFEERSVKSGLYRCACLHYARTGRPMARP